ncbi:hypothetical protein CAEBREN_16998 [Caenorhabditis brenneri]|uniref:Sdz-33 F-box domain-containing protein n=1 Tax=Caenorhabditis brenneri TaxID=135651 RepID=G0MCI2_CAEBE|nr:hypothetical protein CAEBREN_16998 [Caenorhabditis brenneri]
MVSNILIIVNFVDRNSQGLGKWFKTCSRALNRITTYNCANISRKLRDCFNLIILSTIANETFNQIAEEFSFGCPKQLYIWISTHIINKDTYNASGLAIQVDDLELIDCRIISFFESSFEAAEFNQVIRNWIGGKYEKLEVLIFWVADWHRAEQ